MAKSKQLTYVIKTNWLHLLGFYICIEAVMLFQAVNNFMEEKSWTNFAVEAIWWAPFLIFTYGLMFLISFYGILIFLDIICIKVFKMSAFHMVVAEWLIISPVFIYWAFDNQYWLWIALVISFLGTQFIRSKKIDRWLANSVAV
jgi:hypothetical protein